MNNKKETVVELGKLETAIFFVIILIVMASLSTTAFILGKKYENKTIAEQEEKIEDVNIDALKKIVGLSNENCYEEDFNNYITLAYINGTSNIKEEDIERIYHVYINQNKIGTIVDNKYCNIDNEYDICHRTTENDLQEFLKSYDFNYSAIELLNVWDNEDTDHTYHYNINDNVNCMASSTHNTTYWYGMGNDKLSPTEYITISDEKTSFYDETPTIEKYNYIFRKATSNSKSNYYLIKVEKVD